MIRIIESSRVRDGSTERFFVFCLPASKRSRASGIANCFNHLRFCAKGNAFFSKDDAGIAGSYKTGVFATDNDFFNYVVSMLNKITSEYDFFVAPSSSGPSSGSVFYVDSYGAPGAPTFNFLMNNSNFSLPYLR
jgi:hypothetical protein